MSKATVLRRLKRVRQESARVAEPEHGLVHMRIDGEWRAFIGFGFEASPGGFEGDVHFPEWLGRMVRPTGKEARQRARFASEQAAAEMGFRESWKEEPVVPLVAELMEPDELEPLSVISFLALTLEERALVPDDEVREWVEECMQTYQQHSEYERARKAFNERFYDHHFMSAEEFALENRHRFGMIATDHYVNMAAWEVEE